MLTNKQINRVSVLRWLALGSVFLLGVLPYISTIKLPPIPSFWSEWVAVVLAGGLITSLRANLGPATTRSTTRPVQIPAAAVSFLVFAAVLLVQLVLRQPVFRGAPTLAVLALALASLTCMAGSRIRLSGETALVLDRWSIALLIALGLNVIDVFVEREGLHVYIYQLGTRTPPSRAEGLLGQANQLAVFASLASAAAHYLWMRGRLPSVGHVLVSMSAGILIAGSASRAGALLWIFGAILAALALRENPRRREGQWLLTLGAVLFVTAQFIWRLLASPAQATVTVLRNDTLGRIELLRDSWALIEKHPVAGVGFGNFMGARWTELSTSLFEPAANHAHNLLAQVLVELGLLGGAFVLLPLGWALWNCWRVVIRRGVEPAQFLAATVPLLLAGYSLVEYPLWYTFFLMPFALLLGLVNQNDLTVHLSPAPRIFRMAGWALAFIGCAVLALDYHRSEELYSNLELQQRQQKGKVTIPLQQARDVAAFSAFDMYANLMYSRALTPDGFFAGYKSEIAERATIGMTNQETIARQVALLVAADETEAARHLLERTRRNPDLERATREILVRLSALHPTLQTFVRTLPALSPTGARPLGN